MSIKDHAMLVSLTVGKAQMTKTDGKGTAAAEEATNARNAGHYRKDLYPKHLVKPITNAESTARAYIESVCYQWGRGEYLLPTIKFMEFTNRMNEFKTMFEQAVTLFLQNWVYVLDEAKVVQGDLFNEADYPDLSDLRRRFYFDVSYKPVTDTNDFRVSLQAEELEILRESVEKQMQSQYEDVLRQPLERLREAMGRLHDTMGKDDREVLNPRTGKYEVKPPIFRDTVVDNIIHEINLLRDFADVLPADVVALADEVEASVPDAETLRVSSSMREIAKDNSAVLLDTINKMLGV
jgi:hypothetical protein